VRYGTGMARLWVIGIKWQTERRNFIYTTQ